MTLLRYRACFLEFSINICYAELYLHDCKPPTLKNTMQCITRVLLLTFVVYFRSWVKMWHLHVFLQIVLPNLDYCCPYKLVKGNTRSTLRYLRNSNDI